MLTWEIQVYPTWPQRRSILHTDLRLFLLESIYAELHTCEFILEFYMKLCIYLFIYFIYKTLAAAEIVTQNVKVLSRKFNLMVYMHMGSFDEKSPFVLVFDK